MYSYRNFAALAALVVAACQPTSAWASCGQALCSVDARLDEGEPLGAGALRLGLEMEYIEQDEPWVGYQSADVGSIPRPDHNEVGTTNLTWKWSADVGLSDRWSLGVMLPLAYREHLHLESAHNEDAQEGQDREQADMEEASEGAISIGHATGTPERWDYTNLGDLQLVGNYSLLAQERTTASLYFGLKLPTGQTDIRNSNGEEAEITLQPGTGSVDPLVGARLQHRVPLGASERLLSASLGVHARTQGSDGRFGYRPGTEVVVTAATRYALFERLQPAIQINYRYRDRDHVGNAPGVPAEHTGGEALYLSPGLWLGLGDRVDGHAFIQVPVMQRVNGIQLVSGWNFVMGLTYRLDV